MIFILLFFHFQNLWATNFITYQAQIIKPDGKALENNSVQFIVSYRNSLNNCTIYREMFSNVDMTSSAGLVVLKLGNGDTPIYAPRTLKEVFDNKTSVSCEEGGSQTVGITDNRILYMQFNDGSGWQTVNAMEIDSVPFAWYAEDSRKFSGLLSSDFTKKSDIPGCLAGEVLTANASGDLSCVVDSGGGGSVTSVTASGPLASSGGATPNITITQASGATSGYLSSADWTTFNNKLSNFSTMTSADVISALTFTPVNSATAVTSVAGRTGVVTLSSADISGLGNSAGLNVGTGVGTVAAGDDGRFTDERTPLNNSVTSAKIVDGTIISADIANSTITLNKLNQDSASTGQVIKWNGSAWVASSDDSGAGGTVTSVTASGPLASSGGGTPNITITQASGATSGYLSSADWTTFNNKLSNFSTMTSADVISALTFTPSTNVLPSGNIFVGNGSNVATAVVVSGDAIISNTGVVTLTNSAGTRTNLGLGTAAVYNVPVAGDAGVGEVVKGDDSRLLDARTPIDNSVTSSKIVDGTIISADIANSTITLNKLNQDSASTGQVIKWNGSAWVASSDDSGAGGTVTSVTASGPLASSGGGTPNITLSRSNGTTDGYLASTDWTTFNNKLSNFSTMTSADVISALTFTPLSNANGFITFDKFNQNSASTGQVIKWNGSAWVASSDDSGAGGTVTSVTASGPLASSGGTTPNITLSRSNGTTDGYLASTDWTTFNNKLSNFSTMTSADVISALTFTPSTNVLPSGNIFVGNGSNVATAVVVSGDAIISNTGVVTLTDSSTARFNLGLGTAAELNIAVAGDAGVGEIVKGDDSRLVDARTPIDNSVTSAKIVDGTIISADIANSTITLNKLNQDSASTGQVIKWNGSAWVASSDDSGAGGTVTSVTASGPLASSGGTTPNITLVRSNGTTDGYLASTDWTTFNNKLSNFSTMTSADVISALTFTPVNSATAVTSVAGRIGVVTLSSADISGLGNSAGLNVGTGVGTVAAGDDGRFTDERTPLNNSVTSAKIVDGTIISADIANSTITLNKLNQDSASTGQVIKWNGSAWVASSDDSGAGGTVTSVTASGPLASSGGTTPNITLVRSNGTTDGYLASTDWTTFNNKLSNFSTMTSADVISALTFTPVSSASLTNYVLKAGDSMTGNLSISSGNGEQLQLVGTSSAAGLGITNDVGTKFLLQTTGSGSNPANMFALRANATAFGAGLTVNTSNQFGIGAAPSGTEKVKIGGDILVTEMAAPATSSLTEGRIYFDSTSKKFRVSENGNAYVDLINSSTVTSVTASGPLASSGGTTPNITLARSNGTTDGYLASTDWTTFNNKLSNFSTMTSADVISALTFTPSTNVLPSGNIFVGNGSNVASPVTLSGDGTLANTGVMTLTNSATTRTNLGLGLAAVYNVPVAGDAGITELVRGDDSRLVDARTPIDNSVTSAKIANGTIVSADLSSSVADGLWSVNVSGDVARNSGNVGVGTLSPTARMHVKQDINSPAGLAIENMSTGASAAAVNYIKSDRTRFGVISFIDQDNTVSSSGEVGYNHSLDSMYFKTNGVTDRMVINSSGRIGMGVPSPSYAVDVSGDVNVTGSFRVNGVALSAGSDLNGLSDSMTNYANNSMFLGSGAGAAYVSGNNNTVIGKGALSVGTTGLDDNTAIGYNALRDNQAGGNTAIGSFSLVQNTTGYSNTAIGPYALSNITDSYENVAVGAYAGESLASGQNVAIGSGALNAHNHSLGGSVAVGRRALYNATTGIMNIALGVNAGDNITTGSYNIIIGPSVAALAPDTDNQLNIGNLLSGDMTPGTSRLDILGASSVSGDFTITGTAYKPGGGTWTATSDIRLKDVHGSYQKGLQDILKINPIIFNYKKNNIRREPSNIEFVGVSAQDYIKIFPESVKMEKDGYYSVNNSSLIYAVVNAIKELFSEVINLKKEVQKIITELNNKNSAAEVEALRKENTELKMRLEQFEKRLEKIENK